MSTSTNAGPISTGNAATASSAASTAAPRRSDTAAPRRFRRSAALTAAALTTVAATVAFAPASQAATVAPAPMENAQAYAAVSELTSGSPGTTIPADFATLFDYQPTMVDGLLVNPDGDCSSPVTLPAEFENACKAHDLGYDLLRYADRHGEPLGAWARRDLDATLGDRMHEACDTRDDPFSRLRCNTMAGIAGTFVDLNSRRQDYASPVTESLLGTSGSGPSVWLLGLGGLGVLGLGAAITVIVDALRRLRADVFATAEVAR